jgi:signal transduction histidine kinase
VHNRGAIAPDLLPQIFAPFVSRQGMDSSEGLGLGLYIVRQIVLAHGGDIDVHSTSDEGTTFSVRLPRQG